MNTATFRAPQLGLPGFPAKPEPAPCPPTIRERLAQLREEFAAAVAWRQARGLL